MSEYTILYPNDKRKTNNMDHKPIFDFSCNGHDEWPKKNLNIVSSSIR